MCLVNACFTASHLHKDAAVHAPVSVAQSHVHDQTQVVAQHQAARGGPVGLQQVQVLHRGQAQVARQLCFCITPERVR